MIDFVEYVDPITGDLLIFQSGYLIGDFNSDGIVNASDLTMLIGYITSNDPAGDLNGDGSTDHKDVMVFDAYWFKEQ